MAIGVARAHMPDIVSQLIHSLKPSVCRPIGRSIYIFHMCCISLLKWRELESVILLHWMCVCIRFFFSSSSSFVSLFISISWFANLEDHCSHQCKLFAFGFRYVDSNQYLLLTLIVLRCKSLDRISILSELHGCIAHLKTLFENKKIYLIRLTWRNDLNATNERF